MDSLTRILTELTGQGWEIIEQTYHRVVLSKPYEDWQALQSWNVGVMVASVTLGCVAFRCPPSGAILLGLVSVGGFIWGMLSMFAWVRPIQVLYVWRDDTGNWQEYGPLLEKG